ncbi:Methyltransferase-like protein 22 [Gonapodya sp. JEL0774]|nr:Methyltransferase-like protein 22 [Gonapodya sp. JEL0774]
MKRRAQSDQQSEPSPSGEKVLSFEVSESTEPLTKRGKREEEALPNTFTSSAFESTDRFPIDSAGFIGDGGTNDVIDECELSSNANDDDCDRESMPDNLDELHLSDVHTGSRHPAFTTSTVTSEISLLPPSCSVPDGNPSASRTITIHHRMSTTLQNVGLQLWSGALLLADYILQNPELVRGRSTMELGAGLGLPSIVAVAFCGAKKVLVTDVGEEVLSLCERNMKFNVVNDGKDKMDDGKVPWAVKEVNWLDDSFDLWADPNDLDDHAKSSEAPTSPSPDAYTWHSSDTLQFQSSVTTLLAADIIYTPLATERLVRRLPYLLQRTKFGKQRTLYMAVERRLTFDLEGKERAPSYDHFWHVVKEVNDEIGKWGLPRVEKRIEEGEGDVDSRDESRKDTQFQNPELRYEQLNTSEGKVPVRVGGCKRTAEMELWRIWLEY